MVPLGKIPLPKNINKIYKNKNKKIQTMAKFSKFGKRFSRESSVAKLPNYGLKEFLI